MRGSAARWSVGFVGRCALCGCGKAGRRSRSCGSFLTRCICRCLLSVCSHPAHANITIFFLFMPLRRADLVAAAAEIFLLFIFPRTCARSYLFYTAKNPKGPASSWSPFGFLLPWPASRFGPPTLLSRRWPPLAAATPRRTMSRSCAAAPACRYMCIPLCQVPPFGRSRTHTWPS